MTMGVDTVLQASTHGAEEEASLQLKLEYMSGPEMAEEGPGEPKVGRHLLLPLRMRPSHPTTTCGAAPYRPSLGAEAPAA